LLLFQILSFSQLNRCFNPKNQEILSYSSIN
jgi:hypothetical protein